MQPVLTDTEAETSIELDPYGPCHVTRDAPNLTKSVFNIAFEKFLEQHESGEVKDYEARLHQEIQEWDNIWRQTFIEAKQAREKLPPIDISILSPEKRAYLEKRPNLQAFVKKSKEFRYEAHCFLEKDIQEFNVAQENLQAICEFVSDTVKNSIIQEQLSNNTNCSRSPGQ